MSGFEAENAGCPEKKLHRNHVVLEGVVLKNVKNCFSHVKFPLKYHVINFKAEVGPK